MTLSAFLGKLKQTPRRWALCGGNLRLDLGRPMGFSACPISSLFEAPATSWHVVAGRLGLDLVLAQHIVQAADAIQQYDHELRRQLLDACDIAEDLLLN